LQPLFHSGERPVVFHLSLTVLVRYRCGPPIAGTGDGTPRQREKFKGFKFKPFKLFPLAFGRRCLAGGLLLWLWRRRPLRPRGLSPVLAGGHRSTADPPPKPPAAAAISAAPLFLRRRTRGGKGAGRRGANPFPEVCPGSGRRRQKSRAVAPLSLATTGGIAFAFCSPALLKCFTSGGFGELGFEVSSGGNAAAAGGEPQEPQPLS